MAASAHFEELDWRPTPIGAVSLRRRRIFSLGIDAYEVLLGDEHLMSSLSTESEKALATRALALLAGRPDPLSVLVGGLGLGYTAAAGLASPAVGELLVIEYLRAVIDWHEEGLVPLDPPLAADPRARVVEGDFFSLAKSDDGFDYAAPGREWDAILLDVDHAPDRLLDGRSESFYAPEGLSRLARRLAPDGVFGLWSDDAPDNAFVDRLTGVFGAAIASPVVFANPLQPGREVVQTVYLAGGAVGGG